MSLACINTNCVINPTELTASCRNFAPLFGILRESATGSASGALACYLAKHLNGIYGHRFTFRTR
ncbi:PhzF family phenazine biosynthesis protein [Vibrio lentus]|nr:PhzF family phenazine biosynthesis protein [Vibrio lentus]